MASTLDYESANSYSLTLTASDGTNQTQENIAFNISDVALDSLVTSLANTLFTETTAEGTAVASVSSITNPDNETLTYTLSGTGSSDFPVNSTTGAITNSKVLDYATATQYNLTLTTTGGTPGDTASTKLTH